MVLDLESYFIKVGKLHSRRFVRDALLCLDEMFGRVVHTFADWSLVLLTQFHKKTVDEKIIQTVALLLFHSMRHRLNLAGERAVHHYEEYVHNVSKRSLTETKSGTHFPVSRVRRAFQTCLHDLKRGHAHQNLSISVKGMIYLTAVLEFLFTELLRVLSPSLDKIRASDLHDVLQKESEESRDLDPLRPSSVLLSSP